MSLEDLERLMPKEISMTEAPIEADSHEASYYTHGYNGYRGKALQALKGKVVVLADLKEEEIRDIIKKNALHAGGNYYCFESKELNISVSTAILKYIQSKARGEV